MRFLPVLLLAAALTGCATAAQTTASATAEERARCEAMARNMGTGDRHSHTEMKGAGPDPMNAMHARCRAILSTSK